MTNQDIFDMLADLEQMTFYHDISTQTHATTEIHELANKILIAFAAVTGCHN